MKIDESNQRQAELEKLLLELSFSLINESEIEVVAARFKELYSDGFRHNYSRFFPLVVEIFKEENSYNQDILSDNLEHIRLIVEKDYFEAEDKDNCQFVGLYKPLMKLADHINLEIGRYSQNHIYENKIIDLEKRSKTVQDQLDKSKDALEKTNEKLQSAQKEYIAILGIFSAVVLAFTAGIAFSTSVLENFHKASIYRTLFICLIIAFGLINVLYMLFRFIERIVHGKSDKCFFKDHLSILITNIVLVGLMVAVFFLWQAGSLEKHDKEIFTSNINQSEETSEVEHYADETAQTVVNP